jgi:hypothetical protein
MKIIYCLFIVLALMLYNCTSEDTHSEKQNPENILPLSEEYSWVNNNSTNFFGEVLYVPIYSSIYHLDDRIFDLTATLSIHNTDINSKITILKIDYYDTDGNLVRKLIDDEFDLTPLQSKQFVIKQTDVSGGTGAKFIIQWMSEKQVIKPVVEAVMISTSSTQGISFKTESRILSSKGY